MDAKALNELVHDREAAFYDDRFAIDFTPRTIGREVRRALAAVMGEVPTVARALDVGCGTGFGAVGLGAAAIAATVHACDLSTAMVERTAANATRAGVDVLLARSDAERLPYATDSFDLVVARGVLHHVPEPLDAMTEIRRVLAPGGTAVVLAEPTPGGERQVGAVVGVAVRAVEGWRKVRRVPDDPEHRNWELASIAANLHTFAPEDVATLAEKAGFEDITVGTASWAWILALGLNYYLTGELGGIARNPLVRRAARAGVDLAAAFDRAIGDHVIPHRWRHTVQAVLR